MHRHSEGWIGIIPNACRGCTRRVKSRRGGRTGRWREGPNHNAIRKRWTSPRNSPSRSSTSRRDPSGPGIPRATQIRPHASPPTGFSSAREGMGGRRSGRSPDHSTRGLKGSRGIGRTAAGCRRAEHGSVGKPRASKAGGPPPDGCAAGALPAVTRGSDRIPPGSGEEQSDSPAA